MKNKIFGEELETEELLQKLNNNGYGKLVECFLLNDGEVYTRSGRLNKSGACRALDCNTKELETAFEQCREILKKDLD